MAQLLAAQPRRTANSSTCGGGPLDRRMLTSPAVIACGVVRCLPGGRSILSEMGSVSCALVPNQTGAHRSIDLDVWVGPTPQSVVAVISGRVADIDARSAGPLGTPPSTGPLFSRRSAPDKQEPLNETQISSRFLSLDRQRRSFRVSSLARDPPQFNPTKYRISSSCPLDRVILRKCNPSPFLP
jgi:hypothetical protein